jgi:hypothetical protein
MKKRLNEEIKPQVFFFYKRSLNLLILVKIIYLEHSGYFKKTIYNMRSYFD